MAKIEAPNREYNGRVGEVEFRDGVAETDDLAVIAYCQSAGYRVEGYDQTPPETPVQPDSREVGGQHQVGTPLRDAAVDPRPEDFLPPTNAGQADPHGPDVVSPGLHTVTPGPIVPGPVGDTGRQQARETEAAARTLAGDETVPEVTAGMAAADDQPGEVEYPAGNASQEVWATFAVEHCGANPDEAAGMSRNELRDTYGPKAE